MRQETKIKLAERLSKIAVPFMMSCFVVVSLANKLIKKLSSKCTKTQGDKE